MLLNIIIPLVSSHAILTNPTPRTTGKSSFTGDGIKIPFQAKLTEMTAADKQSCANSTATVPRGTAADTFVAGGTVPVSWEITIPHESDPGVRVALQYPGEAFQVLSDNINVNVKSVNVQLPNRPGKAVLQWYWASKEDGGYYLTCSDINIISEPRAASQPPTGNQQPAANEGIAIFNQKLTLSLTIGFAALFL